MRAKPRTGLRAGRNVANEKSHRVTRIRKKTGGGTLEEAGGHTGPRGMMWVPQDSRAL